MPGLVECRSCHRPLSRAAKSCPGCGSPDPTGEQARIKSVTAYGCLGLVGLVVFLGVVGTFIPGGTAREPDDPRIGAVTACKRAVLLQLKAPSTADFAPFDQWTAERDGGKRVVTGYVDAQNSFGAKLRNDVTCEVYDEGANLRAFAHLTSR